jgi:uncharacterized RDD family membrane protein YckC
VPAVRGPSAALTGDGRDVVRGAGSDLVEHRPADLLDVARHIDKDAHPGRHRIVQAEIERRKSLPAPEVIPPPPRPPVSKYATFWRRVGAILIDGLILMPITNGIHFLAPASGDSLSQATPDFAASLVFYLYSIFFHGRYGQTIGKMLTRVRVLDLSEEKLTVSQAITRDLVPLSMSIAAFVVMVNIEVPVELSELDFAAMIPLLVFASISLLWWLAEILTMATNRKRRAVHDFIAGSVVVRISDPAPVAPEADDGRHS